MKVVFFHQVARLFLISLFLLGILGRVLASTSDVFIKEPVFEFGKVKAGEVIDHVFQVDNQSDRTITIVRVKPSCGCTTTGKWDKVIKPGESGTIPVKFNTANMHGKLSKAIRVYLSTSPTKPLLATMTGTVFLAIDVRPPQLRFPPLRDKNTIQTMRVSIFSNLEKPLQLKIAKNNESLFLAKLKTIKKGEAFELEIKNTRALKRGWNKDVIQLETNSPEQPVVEVPVFGYLHKPLECRPGLLTLPPGKLKRNIRKIVLFSINQPGEFKPPLIASPNQFITVKLEPTKKEKEYRLYVLFKKGLRLPDNEKTTIQIKVESLQGEKTSFALPIEQLQVKP